MKLNNSTSPHIRPVDAAIENTTGSTAAPHQVTTHAHMTPDAPPRRVRRQQARIAEKQQKLDNRTALAPAKTRLTQKDLGQLAKQDLSRRGIISPGPLPSVDATPTTQGSWLASSQKMVNTTVSTLGSAMQALGKTAHGLLGTQTDTASENHKASRAPRYDAPKGRKTSQRSVAGRAPTATNPREGLYSDVVAKMRDNGIKKVFVAERHDTGNENLSLITQTVRGAEQSEKGAKGISVYRELSTGGQDEEVEGAMRTPAQRAFVVENLIRDIGDGQVDPESREGIAFARVMAEKGVSIKLMSFKNPKRLDMEKFLQDKDFAIASTGLAHALYNLVKPNKARVPWTGIVEEIDVQGQRVPHLTAKQQKDRFDGFDRARRDGSPAAVVLHSSLWDEDMSRTQLHAHYNKAGLIVMEVPLTKKHNATIVAPPTELALFQQFAKQHSGRIYLLCNGVDGCEEKPIPHDEL